MENPKEKCEEGNGGNGIDGHLDISRGNKEKVPQRNEGSNEE
jgi:hypothetical protein